MRSISTSICLALVACVILGGAVNGGVLTELPAPDGKLNVYALPIGQGDCTIIQCPAKRLFDGSFRSSLLTVVDMGALANKYMSEDDLSSFLGEQKKNIEVVTISHPDADHYNYIPKVLPIDTLSTLKGVYIGCTKDRYRGEEYDPSTMRGWLSAAENSGKLKFDDGNPCTTDCPSIKICRGMATLRMLGANLGDVRCCDRHRNSNSLVLRLEYRRNFKLLLPGDFEDTSPGNSRGVQRDLIDAWKNMKGGIQADFYKIAHHGAYQGGTSSKTKANKDHFLEAVSPKYAFSSSAAPPNRYNHPHCGLYERLLMKNIVPIVRRPINPQAYYTCGRAMKKEHKNMNRNYGIYSTSPEPNMPTIIHIATSGETSTIEPILYRST